MLFVMIPRTITARLCLTHLGGGEAEKKEVFRANCRPDFDVRAVESADGQSAIKRKFHVARAAHFLARSRNLLGQVSSGIDEVGVLYVEVRKEHDLESIAQSRIGIHGLAHCVDEFDDVFREEITRGSLAAEDEGARGHNCLRIAPQPQIKREDVKDSKMLSLVFVNALHLHVEERFRRDDGAGAFGNERGKTLLVSELGGAPLLLKLRLRQQAVRDGGDGIGHATSRHRRVW